MTDKIYSPNRKYWCYKTSKESAKKLFKSLDKLSRDMNTRGANLIVPPKSEWVVKLKGDRYIYLYDSVAEEYVTYLPEYGILEFSEELNKFDISQDKGTGSLYVKNLVNTIKKANRGVDLKWIEPKR